MVKKQRKPPRGSEPFNSFSPSSNFHRRKPRRSYRSRHPSRPHHQPQAESNKLVRAIARLALGEWMLSPDGATSQPRSGASALRIAALTSRRSSSSMARVCAGSSALASAWSRAMTCLRAAATCGRDGLRLCCAPASTCLVLLRPCSSRSGQYVWEGFGNHLPLCVGERAGSL